MDIDGDLVGDAKAQLAVIDKMERSKPVSAVGKRLGVQDRITRAEAAGLFVHELPYAISTRAAGNGRVLPRPPDRFLQTWPATLSGRRSRVFFPWI